MVTLYDKLETDFQHNGIGSLNNNIINPKIKWMDNGLFSLEFEYPLFGPHGLEIENSSIIKASDPETENLFFVYKIIPSMGYIKVYCYQVFYKLAFNSINDTNVVSKNGQGALTQLSGATQYSHKFKFTSDISNVANSRIVRKNPVEILLDSNLDNSFVNRWGGHIVRHGFNISMNQAYGSNKGYSIRHKKDLIGYEATIDETSVVTRIRPLGYDGLLLPEIYVDSLLVNHYPEPRIQEYEYSEVKVGDGEGEFATNELAYAELRRLAKLEYSNNKVDVPQGVYKIDFVNLKDTEEYKNFAPLKQILPGDTVTVTHEEDGLNIIAQMVEYEWDPLSKSYSSVTLGNYEKTFTSTLSKVDKIQNDLKEINNQITLVYTAANGKNQVFVGASEPVIDQNSAEGDLWFKKNGDKTELWILRKVNSELQWVVEMSDATQEELRAQVAAALATADEAKQEAIDSYNNAVTDAQIYTNTKAAEFDNQLILVNQDLITAKSNADSALIKADDAIIQSGFAKVDSADAVTAVVNMQTSINGLQTTVADKADATTVTQLATQWIQTTELVDGHTGQISNLGEQINFKVTKGEATAQINIEAGITLIQNDKLLLDADTYIMGTTFANDVKVKSLEAVYADVINLRTQMLTADVIDSTMISSDTALITKLFATDANVNILTAKTAFINSVKAIDIVADRITGGTFNGSNMNMININVSSLVGNISNFVQSNWNNAVGGGVSINGSGIVNAFNYLYEGSIRNQGALKIADGQISLNGTFTNSYGRTYTYLNADSLYSENLTSSGSVRSLFKLSGDGLQIQKNGESARYTQDGFYLSSAGDASVKYYSGNARIEIGSYNGVSLGVNAGGGFLNRITTGGGQDNIAPFVDIWADMTMRAKLNMNNNSIDNAYQVAGLNVLYFKTTTNRITEGSDGQFYINGSYQVNIGTTAHGGVLAITNNQIVANRTLNMNGNSINNQSDRRLKTNINSTSTNSLDAICRWNFVDYDWIEPTKPKGTHLGLIAQDTPEIMQYDSDNDVYNINSSKQTMMNSHAIQQLNNKVVSIETVATASNALASIALGNSNQALTETQQLKQEIQELKQKIQQLESVA